MVVHHPLLISRVRVGSSVGVRLQLDPNAGLGADDQAQARESLKVFVPAARLLGLDAVELELAALASGTLERNRHVPTASGGLLTVMTALLPAAARTRWPEEWLGELHALRAPQPGPFRCAHLVRRSAAGHDTAQGGTRQPVGTVVTGTLPRAGPAGPPVAGLPGTGPSSRSTSSSPPAAPDPVKAELRSTIYELFDQALRSAGIRRRHRGRFTDRGDGVLALIHPVDQAPKAVLPNQAVPALTQLLAKHNAGLPSADRPQRQLRVRVVVHAGEIHYDTNGCFGEALDIAFRLGRSRSQLVRSDLSARTSPSTN